MMTEWPKVSGCKPADESLRRFESCSCYNEYDVFQLLLYKISKNPNILYL